MLRRQGNFLFFLKREVDFYFVIGSIIPKSDILPQNIDVEEFLIRFKG